MPLRTRRKVSPPQILVARPLTRDDLRHLDKPRGALMGRVAFFREAHHRVARLIAAGIRFEQIIDITGYSYGRLSVLRLDPAFQELIAQYKAAVNEKHTEAVDEFRETALSNMKRMERQVEEHLDISEEAGELIPLKTLSTLISDRADRLGYGKQSTKLNVNVDMASKLERARERVTNAKQIEGTVLSNVPSIAPAASATNLPVAASPDTNHRAARGALLRQRLNRVA